MSLESLERLHSLADTSNLSEMWVSVSDAAYSMSANDRVVKITATGTTAFNVTLPPVAEAAGKMYFFRRSGGGTGTVNIIDYSDDAGLPDIAIADGAQVVLVSDGEVWYQLK